MAIVSDKPIIAIDVDEPQADFVGSVLDEIEDITGRRRGRHEINCFDISSSLDLTREQSDELWRRVGSPGFCAGLRPMADAKEGLRALRTFADVRALTSPFKSATWAHERENWLLHHLEYEREHIIQTPGKDVVFAHVFLDDKIETLFKWRDRWPGSHAVRYVAPWNDDRGWDGHSVHNMGEFVRLARALVGR